MSILEDICGVRKRKKMKDGNLSFASIIWKRRGFGHSNRDLRGAKKKTTTTTPNKKTKIGTNIKDSYLFLSFIVYRSSLGHSNSHKLGAQRQQQQQNKRYNLFFASIVSGFLLKVPREFTINFHHDN